MQRQHLKLAARAQTSAFAMVLGDLRTDPCATLADAVLIGLPTNETRFDGLPARQSHFEPLFCSQNPNWNRGLSSKSSLVIGGQQFGPVFR
jgi:hypothetical protein